MAKYNDKCFAEEFSRYIFEASAYDCAPHFRSDNEHLKWLQDNEKSICSINFDSAWDDAYDKMPKWWRNAYEIAMSKDDTNELDRFYAHIKDLVADYYYDLLAEINGGKNA